MQETSSTLHEHRSMNTERHSSKHSPHDPLNNSFSLLFAHLTLNASMIDIALDRKSPIHASPSPVLWSWSFSGSSHRWAIPFELRIESRRGWKFYDSSYESRIQWNNKHNDANDNNLSRYLWWRKWSFQSETGIPVFCRRRSSWVQLHLLFPTVEMLSKDGRTPE